ncbi:MAG: DUF4440 domain-containing protein [Acidobacteriota bacterium]
MTKKILVLISALILASACAAPPTNREAAPPTNTNRASESSSAPLTEAEVIAKEKAVWDALKKKDYDAFSNMLATDYLEVGSEGVYDKAGIVTYLKDLEFTDATFSGWRLLPIDKNAVLLIYSLTLKGKFKGEDIPPGPYWVGSAWVNRDGKWQAIYYQETLEKRSLPPPTPAATSSVSPAGKVAEATVPGDPIEREKALWDTLKRRDYDTFATFLDSAQVQVNTNGIYDKAGTLKGVRLFDLSKVELSDFKTVQFDNDASLVTYMVTVPGAKPVKERASTVWVNRGAKWSALYHQGTPIEATPAASASPAN